MNKEDREKISSIVATLGSIIGIIIGMIYFGIGGAILGFFVAGLTFYILTEILIEADWGCIGRLIVSTIIFVVVIVLIIILWRVKPWELMNF